MTVWRIKARKSEAALAVFRRKMNRLRIPAKSADALLLASLGFGVCLAMTDHPSGIRPTPDAFV